MLSLSNDVIVIEGYIVEWVSYDSKRSKAGPMLRSPGESLHIGIKEHLYNKSIRITAFIRFDEKTTSLSLIISVSEVPGGQVLPAAPVVAIPLL